MVNALRIIGGLLVLAGGFFLFLTFGVPPEQANLVVTVGVALIIIGIVSVYLSYGKPAEEKGGETYAQLPKRL
jgi:uncharacterized membrane protein HdeD (DUF308 family)